MSKRYSYTYRNTAADYMRFYLGNIYSQWTGIVNVVFTGAMLALAAAFWGRTNGLGKGLLVIACLVFPVLQPLVIFLRGRKQAAATPVDTTLNFSGEGMEILVEGHRQQIPWKSFEPVIRRFGLTILRPDRTHAYLLPDRVTGAEAEEVASFVREQAARHGKG